MIRCIHIQQHHISIIISANKDSSFSFFFSFSFDQNFFCKKQYSYFYTTREISSQQRSALKVVVDDFCRPTVFRGNFDDSDDDDDFDAFEEEEEEEEEGIIVITVSR